MYSTTKAFALMGIVALATAGCGLIDPDIADFDLSLPEKEIVVDTSQWQLTTESNTLPAVDCSQSAGVCSLGISDVCGAEQSCFGSCNSDQACDVTILVKLWHAFDLAKEKPELQEIEGKPLVSVTINKIAYKVTENTLNVDSPEMIVYVAPSAVMSPGDPQAQAIGTIAVVPAGTTVEEQDVLLNDGGEDILAGYMKQYSVPFNVIIGSTVELSPGDVLPTGKLTAIVVVAAVAGL